MYVAAHTDVHVVTERHEPNWDTSTGHTTSTAAYGEPSRPPVASENTVPAHTIDVSTLPAADSEPVRSLPLCEIRLMNDARFPWLIMVPRRLDIADLIDLAPTDRAVLIEEIALVAETLKAITGCQKLNIASLGNAVRQLHIHVIARNASDAAWPRPVWGVGEAVPYRPDERDRLIGMIRTALPS